MTSVQYHLLMYGSADLSDEDHDLALRGLVDNGLMTIWGSLTLRGQEFRETHRSTADIEYAPFADREHRTMSYKHKINRAFDNILVAFGVVFLTPYFVLSTLLDPFCAPDYFRCYGVLAFWLALWGSIVYYVFLR